jgi:glycerol-3-phosphate dehydrogenase
MGQSTGFIGGTKGSHLVLDHPALAEAIGNNEIFFENSDGRIVLIFPYLGRVMIGTTDIRVDDPDQAVCTEDEIDYMLNLVKRVFPDITVAREQIVFRFCGVRPLPAMDAKTTGTISRDHSIRSVAANGLRKFPIHSLVGGKWTTYRAFSEQAADLALKELGKPRQQTTRGLPIGGGKGFPTSEAAREHWLIEHQQRTELPKEQLSTLLDRYGTQASAIAEYISAGNDTALTSLPSYSQRELEYLIQHERIGHLDDLLLRRTLIAMLGHLFEHPEALSEVAEIMAKTQNWDAKRRAHELEHARTVFAQRHQLVLEPA